jgi:hypothetical protein
MLWQELFGRIGYSSISQENIKMFITLRADEIKLFV